jgi:hypothetical protein
MRDLGVSPSYQVNRKTWADPGKLKLGVFFRAVEISGHSIGRDCHADTILRSIYTREEVEG